MKVGVVRTLRVVREVVQVEVVKREREVVQMVVQMVVQEVEGR